MTPASDIDLLFLDSGAGAAGAADAVLYPLWDAGFVVGHAVRSPAECDRQAAEDLATLCSQLDARTLVGEGDPAERVRGGSWSAAGTAERFETLLRVDRLRRTERHGRLGHQLRASVRDSAGGLRDAHGLRWLEMGGRVRPGTSASVAGAIDLFLLVRTAAARASDDPAGALEPESHDAVASLLGIGDEPGWEARDVLVRRIADRARWVDVLWDLDLGSWASARAVVASLDPDQATALDPQAPDPRVVAAWGTGLGEARWTDALRDAVLPLLASPGALEMLDGLGILAHLVPGWADVRCRPQRDPYHRSHVDTHLVWTAADADDPALAVGALLHDIGKVGQGSHEALGEGIAAHALDRMGIASPAREEILFLVREHLLLSDTAVRRDIDDEDLVLRVAAAIEDERHLDLLLALTRADARATGPTAASPWRLGLVEELARRIREVFRVRRMSPDRAERLRAVQAAIREATGGGPEVDAFQASVPPEYLARVDPAEAPTHVALVRPVPSVGEVRTAVRAGTLPGTARLAVGARDHPGLLATIAGALAVSGLSIVTAEVFTTGDGAALDVFEVRSLFEPDAEQIPGERWERFVEAVSEAAAGSLDLAAAIDDLRKHYPHRGARPRVSVKVDEKASRASTVLEVSGPDRPGLLFGLCRALAEAGLDVHAARVATYGPRIVDAFYVREADGSLPSKERIAEVRAALRTVVESA